MVIRMDERKGNPATKAKNRYNKKAYDRIQVVVPKGEKENYAQLVTKLGYKSLNEFIVRAIEEKISREGSN